MLNIILVNYNSSDDTKNCIDSIINSNQILPVNIKIFDNNSKEEEARKLKEYIAKINNNLNSFTKSVECHFSNQNLGFAVANNYYMKKAMNTDFLWILNNDTLVNSELLKKIAENLPERNEVLYFDCHTFSDEFHDSGVHYVNLFSGKNRMQAKSRTDFEYICGASFVIQKTDFMPYFDESYFLYYEDCDYGMRLKKASYRYRKLENCYFKHKIGSSGSRQIKKINLIQLRSQVLFMKRYSKSFYVYKFLKFLYLAVLKQDFDSAKKFLFFCRTVSEKTSFSEDLPFK